MWLAVYVAGLQRTFCPSPCVKRCCPSIICLKQHLNARASKEKAGIFALHHTHGSGSLSVISFCYVGPYCWLACALYHTSWIGPCPQASDQVIINRPTSNPYTGEFSRTRARCHYFDLENSSRNCPVRNPPVKLPSRSNTSMQFEYSGCSC